MASRARSRGQPCTARMSGLAELEGKPRPEVPFIAGCSHFTRKNARFRAPASSPKPAPCNIHAAITMRFAAPRTHPCSHYIAICINSLQNTVEKPIDLETIQTTRRTQEVPFIAGCSHFTRKNARFRAPAPQHKPHATFMQPSQCILQHDVANPHVSTHMATPDYNNHAAITQVYCYVMSSLTPQPHTTLH